MWARAPRRGQRLSVYHGHRNLVWTFAKNMPLALAVIYLPHHAFVNLLSTAMISARGQVRVVIRAKRDAIKGLPRMLRKRRSVQRLRRIDALELRAAMEKGLGAYMATPGAQAFFCADAQEDGSSGDKSLFVRRQRSRHALLTTNGGNYLPHSLEALQRQTVAPHRTIVVDNGSTDGSPGVVRARFPGVELIPLGRNTGFAAANNIGVTAAQDCEHVALLNADAFPEPTRLKALMHAAAEHPRHAVFASRDAKC